MTIQAPYFPIIYVRGFAATMREIEDATASPYMGFNDGATKIRQRHDREIVRFVFESPLVRLMKDENETITFRVLLEDKKTPLRYGLASVDGMGVATRPAPRAPADASGQGAFEIPLGFNADDPAPPRPGFRGRLILRVT
jgi:hypothetical protein